MKKILILGKGYVGNFISNYLTENTDHHITTKNRTDLDYHNEDVLTTYIKQHSIDYVVGAFGYTGSPNVDACENNKEMCVELNRTILVKVAQSCVKLGIGFGFVSSGCIYTHKTAGKIDWFTENEEPNFGMTNPEASFYSRTKHAAEVAVKSLPIHVWRIRMPFEHSANPKNYLYKILKYNTLLDNEYNSLTYLPDLGKVINASINKTVPVGTYNVVNTGAVTVRDITSVLNRHNLTNSAWEYVEYDTLVKRRLIVANRSNCVLSNEKIQKYVSLEGAFGAISAAAAGLAETLQK